ncbi:MAG: DUF501 domain-containing protein [Dermatophilaceae bacterium]
MTARRPPPPDPADLSAVSRQLGRTARGVLEVAHRCACGEPDVIRTEPRLPDGTPFPTSFYATCPRLTGAVSTLESQGLMRELTERLRADPVLRERYSRAHLDYLTRRAELGEVAEIAGVSAGGMPDRVKCLHVLVAHSLAAGPGVNPLGDEALDHLEPWWNRHPCRRAAADVHVDAAPGASSGAHTTADGLDETG